MALIDAPLGKSSDYPDAYDPQLLFPVAREENRRRIGLVPMTTDQPYADSLAAYLALRRKAT